MIKILLIDDDELIAEMLEYSLASFKVELVVSTSLNDIKVVQYDMIISDLNLTETRGEETLKAVREKFPKERLVVISGVVPSEMDDWSEQYSVEMFIEKDYLLDKAALLVS